MIDLKVVGNLGLGTDLEAHTETGGDLEVYIDTGVDLEVYIEFGVDLDECTIPKECTILEVSPQAVTGNVEVAPQVIIEDLKVAPQAVTNYLEIEDLEWYLTS